MTGSLWGSLVWFIVVLAMIPIALWLLKRSPLTPATSRGAMRVVGAMAVAPNQRIVTVEVGSGEDRRWLVVGVSPSAMQLLHTMAAQDEPTSAEELPVTASFAQLLKKLRTPKETIQ